MKSATIGCGIRNNELRHSSARTPLHACARAPFRPGRMHGRYCMNSSHEDFAQRLRHALDYSGFAKGRARIGALAIQYNVSRETARKWLAGLSLPELQRMIDIAKQQRVRDRKSVV